MFSSSALPFVAMHNAGADFLLSDLEAMPGLAVDRSDVELVADLASARPYVRQCSERVGFELALDVCYVSIASVAIITSFVLARRIVEIQSTGSHDGRNVTSRTHAIYMTGKRSDRLG